MFSHNHHYRLPLLVCIFCIAVIFFIGLWPYRFVLVNDVTYTTSLSKIKFKPFGIAFSAPFNPLHVFGANTFTIGMGLNPDNEPVYGIRRIVSMYDLQGKRELLFLGQWETHILLRYYSEDNEIHELGINNILLKRQPQALAVAFTSSGVTLFNNSKNGKQIRSSNLPLSLPKDGGSIQLILGNTPTGDLPWEGTIENFLIAPIDSVPKNIDSIYPGSGIMIKDPQKDKNIPIPILLVSDAKQYLQHSKKPDQALTLYIPKYFTTVKKEVLALPRIRDFMQISELPEKILNFLGFIPLGFILALLFSESIKTSKCKLYILTIGTGFIVSLSIELLQVPIPTRHSSLLDLLFNTTGTAIGVCLLHLAISSVTPANILRNTPQENDLR